MNGISACVTPPAVSEREVLLSSAKQFILEIDEKSYIGASVSLLKLKCAK